VSEEGLLILRLGELRADMKSIVGNGQPGRLNKLENKVNKHDLYIAGAVGAAVLIGYVLQYGSALLPVILAHVKYEDETLLDHQPFYCGFHSGAIASRASLAPLHS